MARRAGRSGRKSREDEGKGRGSEPTVFTAAGLLAFSEEDALFRVKPVHVLGFTIAFMLAVILLNVF